MSNREYAHTLLDRIPESRLAYIVYYLEGAAVPDEAETPNAETQEAFEELDNGGGHAYNGPVENLISPVQKGPEGMPEAALRHEPAAAGHQRAGSPGGTSAPEQGPQPDGQLYPASGMPHSAGLAVDLLPDGYRTLSVSHGNACRPVWIVRQHPAARLERQGALF